MSTSRKALSLHTFEKRFETKTTERFGFVDITDDVQAAVQELELDGGRATIFSPADHCPLVLNERESGLLKDIRRALDRVRLESGSAPTTIGSKSIVFPVVGGRLRLGQWQRLLLLELDQPAERTVVIQVIGE